MAWEDCNGCSEEFWGEYDPGCDDEDDGMDDGEEDVGGVGRRARAAGERIVVGVDVVDVVGASFVGEWISSEPKAGDVYSDAEYAEPVVADVPTGKRGVLGGVEKLFQRQGGHGVAAGETDICD